MQTIFPRNELSLNLIFFKMRSFGNKLRFYILGYWFFTLRTVIASWLLLNSKGGKFFQVVLIASTEHVRLREVTLKKCKQHFCSVWKPNIEFWFLKTLGKIFLIQHESVYSINKIQYSRLSTNLERQKKQQFWV